MNYISLMALAVFMLLVLYRTSMALKKPSNHIRVVAICRISSIATILLCMGVGVIQWMDTYNTRYYILPMAMGLILAVSASTSFFSWRFLERNAR